eukprot:scaffold4732_cov163-Skeletonema_dohrnii-CCMP3373.AAC.1
MHKYASTIDSALIDGGKAFILGADQYTRFGVQNFPDACRQLGLKVTVHEDLLETNFAAEEVDGEVQQEQLMEELELGGYNQRMTISAVGTRCQRCVVIASVCFADESSTILINRPFFIIYSYSYLVSSSADGSSFHDGS